jgi:hypothetical protein
MGNLTERSARRELRALVERALAKEAELSEGAKRRVVNRILRQSGRIAEIGEALCVPVAATSATPTVAEIEPGPQEFDPYAIGAVVTLQRLGADALLDRLAAIKSVENLRSLAVAQNLALKSDWSNADQLRAAIVQSAEQRLAERRAAAS